MKNKIMSFIYRIGNRIVRQTDWYTKNYWKGVCKFWNINQFELDIVNLGSNPGFYAFNYSTLSVKGKNFALGPQSLVHDYAILRNYFSYIKENGIVIVTICPFSCLVSIYGKEHNFRYYTILHPATIMNFDDTERTLALTIKNNPFNAMPMYCIKATIRELLQKIKRIIVRHKVNLKQSADAMMNHWKCKFGINDLAAPLSEKHKAEQKLRKQTLIGIVDFCIERSLKPVIVVPPMHSTLAAQFPKEFIDNYIKEFVKGVDAPFYNYMNCMEMQEKQYYDTALFLSDKGARKFTRMFIEQLRIDNLI